MFQLNPVQCAHSQSTISGKVPKKLTLRLNAVPSLNMGEGVEKKYASKAKQEQRSQARGFRAAQRSVTRARREEQIGKFVCSDTENTVCILW